VQFEITFITFGLTLFVRFEKNLDNYHVVGISTYADDLDFPDEAYQEEAPYPPEEPEHVRTFVQNWLNTCEQVHATFGYFSHYYLSEETDYSEKLLSILQHHDLARLSELFSIMWLTYIGSELIAVGAERYLEAFRNQDDSIKIQTMPSGAVFIRTTPDAKGYLGS
jgi:hypothetical protein